MRKFQKIIFDMDGVITSEMRHWDSARLVVWEALSDPEYAALEDYFFPRRRFPEAFHDHRERIIPQDFIAELKDRAVNSNWDLTFISLSLYVTHLAASLDRSGRELLKEAVSDGAGGGMLSALGQALRGRGEHLPPSDGILFSFFSPLKDARGLKVPEGLGDYFSERTGISANPFIHRGPFWLFCQALFQSWYSGAKLKEEPELFLHGGVKGGSASLKRVYPVGEERTIILLDLVRKTLETLRGMGYTLCIATGRPKAEALNPLRKMNLLHLFDADSRGTQDEVLEGEWALKEAGTTVRLAKPHPYCVLRALHPELSPLELYSLSLDKKEADGVMVGDSVSDIDAAHGAGCVGVGVLTGAGDDPRRKERRAAAFRRAGCDHVIESIADLPNLMKELERERS